METIKIVGKEYPMSFSAMAAKKIAAKHGTLEKFINELTNDEATTEKSIDDIVEILNLLISQGCAYKNYFEKDVPVPENAPVIAGKWTPLPKEALEIAVSVADFNEIADKIKLCITKGKKQKVEVVEKPKKMEAGQE